MAHSAAGGVGFGAGKKPIIEKYTFEVIYTTLQVLPLAVGWLGQYSDPFACVAGHQLAKV